LLCKTGLFSAITSNPQRSEGFVSGGAKKPTDWSGAESSRLEFV
jgi:hypothetical protein